MAKILFLILDFEKPSSKKRILCSVDYIRSRGHEVRVMKVPGSVLGRIRSLGSLGSHDLVVIQKKLFRPVQFLLFKLANRNLVFDFDDAVMFHEVERNEPLRGKHFKRFLGTAAGCKGVIAGNSYLAEFAVAARAGPGKEDRRLIVLPTPVDTEALSPRSYGGPSGPGPVIVGWLGTKGNQSYLKQIQTALDRAVRACPEARIKVVSDFHPDLQGLPLDFKPWSAADEGDDLKSFDIGIMPLADNMWTRGKGGYKLLQYMAAGVASVASPVGINTEIIRQGENGYLARDEGEWTEILTTLIRNPGLREAVGRAGRKTVESRYGIKEYNRRLATFLEGLI